MKKIIELQDITKTFEQDNVLDHINLYVNQNEFLTLLGPSGCGKTTTLRIIGGFEEPTKGRFIFEGIDMTAVPPYLRPINTVFQKYALFPHLNVHDNIAFGLKLKGVEAKRIDQKVDEMLALVNLPGYGNRKIERMSGGQQQRIAIARALVNEPKVLLLDEPLGALDLKLRKDMQHELKRIQQQVGITFIYVTHDQEEALTMSDTIVVLDKGKIQQIGTPIDIYNEPKNAFVADFIGESNIVDGVMHKDYEVTYLKTKFVCVDRGFETDELVDVVIRPEDIELVSEMKASLTGVVESVLFMGVHYEIIVRVDDQDILVHSTRNSEVGKKVGISIIPDNIHIMRKMHHEV